MSKIKHHLSDQLLMSYAAGALPEAFNLVVATHISMCDECRARLETFEAIGGAVLDSAEPETSSNALTVDLAATLDRIKAQDVETTTPRKVVPGVFPKALQDYVGGDLEAVKWRPVGMGVRQAILDTSNSASVRLLYIPAGKALPDHGHHGTEMTLVLQGAFRDDHDRFGRGDIEIATEDLEHTPVAELGADCICLSATDAPLKFSGLLPRLAQRFLRI
ncbi:MAG: ChrR family anti-sigma-E factor [Pseudomonadota bacterium]